MTNRIGRPPHDTETPAANVRSVRSAPCPAAPPEGARSDTGRALTVRAQTTAGLRADPSVYQEARQLGTPDARGHRKAGA